MKEVCGKNFQDLGYPAELVKLHKKQLDKVIKTKKAIKGGNAYVNSIGENGYYEYIFTPLFNDNMMEAMSATTHEITDRKRTGQVLTNLISNAIKYSPKSEKISVQFSVNKNSVQLCVKDFGVGIPIEKQSHVFERFYRVSGLKEIIFPGLGLGLYISTEIIKRKGGKISVESEEHKGSTLL